MNKKAFTLAEVLICLGLIACVAIVTLGPLFTKISNSHLISKVLKVYKGFNTSFKESEMYTGYKVTELSSLEDFIAFFEDPYIGLSHNCGANVCLNDGTEIDYGEFNSRCNTEANGSASALKYSCISLTVDVNGSKKGPNTPGKDKYRFWVTEFGVYPEGNVETCEEGYDCTAYVVMNHKLFNLEPNLDLDDVSGADLGD